MFDIIISSCEKDSFVLSKLIPSIKKFVKNYRRIIVISDKKLTEEENVEWFDEKKFPFTMKDIYENLYGMKEEQRIRKVSYINQLLKLYSHKVITGLTENILICDSDIIFIKDTYFFEGNLPLYGNRIVDFSGYEPYLKHHLKLDIEFDFGNMFGNKELRKKNKFCSGICHHIIYNREIINELIQRIEKKHNQVFWKYYLNTVDTVTDNIEPANCELYYNYINLFHKDKFRIRNIKWLEKAAANRKKNNIIDNFSNHEKNVTEAMRKDCNYIAYHSYDRKQYNNK